MPEPMTFESPLEKVGEPMRANLKRHIQRERERQKREQEQDALSERHKREQELKRKQDAMTLEEIKDNIVKLENKLEELKNEKHNLFSSLKKVLHDDEARRKEREMVAQSVAQNQPSTPHAYQPYYISGQLLASGGRAHALYPKLTPFSAGVAPPHLQGAPPSNIPSVSQPASRPSSNVDDVRKIPVKRPHERSPSPQPRSSIPYTGNFPNYKNAVSYTISEKPPAGPFPVFAPGIPFDSKGIPYVPAPGSYPVDAHHDQRDYEAAAKYYRSLPPGHSVPPSSGGGSVIPMQNQPKPGQMTSGFPVQRSQSSVNQNSSSGGGHVQGGANRTNEPPRQYQQQPPHRPYPYPPL